jgi:hypothetical protein
VFMQFRAYMLVSVLSIGTCAFAQTKTWDGEAGDLLWTSDSNWDPDGVPTGADSALVSAGGIVRVESDSLVVQSMDVLSGMSIGNSSIQVSGSSHINSLLIQSCCAVDITANGPLLIDGASIFSKLPIFKGTSVTTLGGTLLLDAGIVVDTSASVDLTGVAAAITTMTVRDAGQCSITGTLTMDASASLRTAGSGQWILDGGNIQRVGTSLDVNIQGTLLINSGTLSADEGELPITGSYTINGGEIAVSNNGIIELRGIGMPTIKPTRFSGQGIIDIRTGVAQLGAKGVLIEAAVEGPGGLRFHNGVQLIGDLENTETLWLESTALATATDARISSSGIIHVTGAANIDADIIVRSGGRLFVDGNMTLDSQLRVDSGGTIELRASINEQPIPSGQKLVVNGTAIVPSSVGANFTDVGVPAEFGFGATLRVEDGNLQFQGGATFGNVVVEIVDTNADGDSTVFVGGDADDIVTIPTTMTINATGPATNFILGNTLGNINPSLTIDGTITTNVGVGGTGRFRLLHPDVQGFGEIINRGAFRFERTTNYTPNFTNEAMTEITGALTLDGIALTFENIESAQVLQTNTLVMIATIVRNDGTWVSRGSAHIKRNSEGNFAGLFSNRGMITFESGSQTVEVPFANIGTVIADGSFTTFNEAVNTDVAPPTLSGSWITRNGGRILFPVAPTKLVGPNSHIEGDAQSMPWLPEVDLLDEGADAELGNTSFDGDVELQDGSNLRVIEGASVAMGELLSTGGSSTQVEEGGTLETSGTATVGEPPADPDGDVLDVIGGVIALARGLPGDPTIRTPLLHLHGRLLPMAGRIGALNIEGEILMEDTATLVIETAGPGQTDRAVVTGPVTLAGRVSLDVLTGYTPTIGDELTVMTAAGGFTGAMAGVDSVAPGSVRWRPEVVGTELHLVATCQADFIAPFGVLDFFDVQAFLNFYSAGDLNADLNADGRLDFFDLQAFLNVYSAGCS